jgi:Tfp pilus assembly protein PilF
VRAPEPELYDLAADPGETRNLAAERPERAAALDRLVEEQVEAGRPVAPSFSPDAEERAQLEALGYLQGGAGAGASLGRVGGPDPKRELEAGGSIEPVLRYMNERRGAEALAAYDKIPSPGYPIRLIGANAALLAGDVARAEQEARAALAIAELPDPWVLIARIQLDRGDHELARQSLARATALDAEVGRASLLLGSIAESEGQSEEAMALYRRASEQPRAPAESLWRLAALELEAGRRDLAREVLARVPQVELRLPEAAQRLARAERDSGRPDLARTRIDGALREFPHVAELWLAKGDLLDREGDLRGALAARRNALRIAPKRPAAQNAVAWTLGRLGRNLAEADALAARAIETLGRRPPLLDTLASVRVAQGRFAEALALADEGLAAASPRDRVDLRFRRAEALAGLGRGEEAEQALAEALGEAEGQAKAGSTWAESEQRVRRLLAAAS